MFSRLFQRATSRCAKPKPHTDIMYEEKLMRMKIDQCIEILLRDKDNNTIGISATLLMTLSLVGVLCVGFTYMLQQQNETIATMGANVNALQNQLDTLQYNNTLIPGIPFNGTCVDAIAGGYNSDITQSCSITHQPFTDDQPYLQQVWNYCFPTLNDYCNTSAEFNSTMSLINSALAFCMLGVVALIACEGFLLHRQFSNRLKTVGERLPKNDFDKISNICAELDIECGHFTKLDVLLASLQDKREVMMLPSRMRIAFLMGDKRKFVENAEAPIFQFFKHDRDRHLTQLIFQHAGIMPEIKHPCRVL